jgi:hypothetical protein
MKLYFDDGSFLELSVESDNNLFLSLCARREFNEVTMSSVKLSKEQTEELIEFIKESFNKSSLREKNMKGERK